MTVTVDEFLSHAGVKGMKWGKRKAQPTTADIKGARERQAGRMDKINVKVKDGASEKAMLKAVESFARQQDKVLSHPDQKTANLMTRGEKAVRNIKIAGLVVGAVGVTGTALLKGS